MEFSCKVCGSHEVTATPRKDGKKTDYKCKCGSRKAPFMEDVAEVVEVAGETERVLKHEQTDTGYKIFYGGTYLLASHEEIRKAFMFYCIGKFTMNKVADEMRWTRAEFNALKTAFKITKDAQPFTPYEIDNMTADDMAEIMRIEKKRFAHLKFRDQKSKDIEKEVNRHNKADYFTNEICKRVNALDITGFFVEEEHSGGIPSQHTTIVKITDEHAGLEVDSLHNTYNLSEMHKRFLSVFSWIINNVSNEDDLVVESGGDLVHGKIHGSCEKASSYVMDALEAVIECYIQLICGLRKHGYRIRFTKANGSHSSLESNKMNRTEEENLGRMLPFVLRQTFSKDDGFRYLQPIKGTNHTIVPVGGNNGILTGHGDEMKGVKAYSAFARTMGRTFNINITEFHLGHWHHYKAEEVDNVLVENTLSFCGTDQYASKGGLLGECGFTVHTYDECGVRIGYRVIKF